MWRIGIWFIDKIYEEIFQPVIKYKSFTLLFGVFVSFLAYMEYHFTWTIGIFIFSFGMIIFRIIQLLYRKAIKEQQNLLQEINQDKLEEYKIGFLKYLDMQDIVSIFNCKYDYEKKKLF